jgi:ribose 1,5-bisphosphokinase
VTVSLRYAVYYVPAPHNAWARFGASWFARAHPALRHPRRYGFHATLKAPFRLRSGVAPAQLHAAVDELARAQGAFSIPELKVARLDDLVALVPAHEEPRLAALEARCVRELDALRAPLDALEFARRRRTPLTPLQETLLARWGYPHVLEEFRFHLSLAGPLHGASAPEVPALPPEPMCIDALTVLEEPAADAQFRIVHRAPFPRHGRLVCVVGASGSGKDTLVEWVRERRPAGIAFAQRTITRPAFSGGERHAAVDDAEFDALLARGAFALHWRAHGLRYGIRREIDDWLAQGLTVVVNGSREHLPRARTDYPQIEVVHVTAPDEVLRARLEARAREDAESVQLRLARRPRVPQPALEISNAGPLRTAGEQLLRFLAVGAPAERSTASAG